MSKDIDFSKPLNEDDARYVSDRPWLLVDAELQGIEVTYEADANDAEEAEDGEVVDYTKLKVDDLKAEIVSRNEEIEDDEDKIVPASDKKDDLIAALQADDEANAAE